MCIAVRVFSPPAATARPARGIASVAWSAWPTAREAECRELPSMGFSLTDLFVSALLLGNAGAVLNEDRFLVKLGWGYEQSRNAGPSVKKQIINLLYAVRFLLTIPLIICNVIVILLKLILG